MKTDDLAPNVFEALHWIVGILHRHNVQYQITGGFAARIYGSTRELHDLDFDIPEAAFEVIMPDIKPYIKDGPEHLNDGKWDGVFVSCDYHGQEVDIGAIETIRISNKARTEWIPYQTEYFDTIEREVDGLSVGVLRPEKLIAYKKELDGDHQLVDIEAVVSTQL